VSPALQPDDAVVRIDGLDHVQLAIPRGGEDAARLFYDTLLGLVEVPKPAALAARGGCWFVGPGGLHLHLGVEEPFRPAIRAHIGLVIEDVMAARVALEAAGVATADDESAVAVRRFYAFDPFGNRLEFIDRRDRGFTDPGSA
jgi:catechol 2,3-dioxygenase-like lactoylglutathione lyase family enzyme